MNILAHKLIVAADEAGHEMGDFIEDVSDGKVSLSSGVYSSGELRFLADWLDANAGPAKIVPTGGEP